MCCHRLTVYDEVNHPHVIALSLGHDAVDVVVAQLDIVRYVLVQLAVLVHILVDIDEAGLFVVCPTEPHAVLVNAESEAEAEELVYTRCLVDVILARRIKAQHLLKHHLVIHPLYARNEIAVVTSFQNVVGLCHIYFILIVFGLWAAHPHGLPALMFLFYDICCALYSRTPVVVWRRHQTSYILLS